MQGNNRHGVYLEELFLSRKTTVRKFAMPLGEDKEERLFRLRIASHTGSEPVAM